MRKSSTGSSPPNNTAEVNMELRSRQSEPLPDIPSVTYPRHYTTPLAGQVNYGYEITDNDEYEVPINDEYEVPVNDEYEVPVMMNMKFQLMMSMRFHLMMSMRFQLLMSMKSQLIKVTLT